MSDAAMSTEERRKALEAVTLGHRLFKDAIARLGSLSGPASRPGGALAGRARLVIGGSGAGKTKLLKWVEAQDWVAADLDGKEGDRRPLVYVELAKGVTDRDLVASVMRELGETPPRNWTKFQILDELKHVAAGIGLRVVLFDEAHWLMKSGSVDVREANAEFLKTALNVTGLHLVMAGVRELARLHDLEHAQARRRLLTRIHLRPYNWSLAPERAAFQGILRKYEKAIGYPVKPGSGVGDEDLARRLYLASRGELGVVVQYLTNSIERADEIGAGRITADVLAKVHDDLRAGLDDPIVGSMKAFSPMPAKRPDNPFACSEAVLEKLWNAQFASRVDDSRRTRLAAAPVPGREAVA